MQIQPLMFLLTGCTSCLYILGIITPSKDSFTFCDYNSYEDEFPVKTVRIDETLCHIVTSKAPDVLYWKPANKFISNHFITA